jgi:hypothetical protein
MRASRSAWIIRGSRAACTSEPGGLNYFVLSRRGFLELCAATLASLPCAAGSARAEEAARSGVDRDLRWIETRTAGPDKVEREALVLAPAHGPAGRRYPALLLFHGRGEADDPHAGMHAWRSPYGLAEAYAQLRRAPLGPDPERARFMRPSQLAELQARLAERAFDGLVLICPVTPRPRSGARPEQSMDAYADWIEAALLPHVATLAPLADTPSLGIDGCSMGGRVAAEVFARKPQLFRTFGLVQPALDRSGSLGLARQLAAAARQPGFAGIHLETSTEDPYRRRTEALGRQLRQLGAKPAFDLLPGPHTKAWLQASGTLTMLAWHERMLHLGASEPPTAPPPLPPQQGAAPRRAPLTALRQ